MRKIKRWKKEKKGNIWLVEREVKKEKREKIEYVG
jgi:hypothetical protein